MEERLNLYDSLRDELSEIIEYWESDVCDDDVMDFPEHHLIPQIKKAESFKLYRYTPADYFNIRNIETQKIHLSPNGVMNDAYEGFPEISADRSYYNINRLNDMAYITCFSEEKNNILMWGHYAQGHEGLCLEYDFVKLTNDLLGIRNHLFPVVYRDRRPFKRDIDSLIRSKKALDMAIEEEYEYDGEEALDDVLPLFLTKADKWKYEKEWRVIYTKKQMYDINKDELFNGNIYAQCISAVYLGTRINSEKKDNILEIAERISKPGFRIDVYQAQLSPKGYDLNFVKIN